MKSAFFVLKKIRTVKVGQHRKWQGAIIIGITAVVQDEILNVTAAPPLVPLAYRLTS